MTKVLEKKYGPFKLNGGLHAEDQAVCEAKVVSIDPNGVKLTTDKGEMTVDFIQQGAMIAHDGKVLAVYRKGRRIAASQLRPGDDIVLAEEVTHEAGGKPFMSHSRLDEIGNMPGLPPRYELERSSKDRDDLEAARSEMNEMRQRIAQLEAEKEDAKRQLPQQDGPLNQPASQQPAKQGQQQSGKR